MSVYRDSVTGSIYADFTEHTAPQLIQVGPTIEYDHNGAASPLIDAGPIRDRLSVIEWDRSIVPLDRQCPQCATRIDAAKVGMR
ncbi:hypothetical protein [Nakamurella aerolata]|uniref:Uncharacterized protein n=1 Tax=Nakamurella aerolata TaxID=1656892 RepID=A0A849ACK9_9ACTN|nr:hypothetical protein [Nakamurella aerolata]NNG36911.1 hypothetical protein [Nakamurella aerolata]